MQKTHRKSTVAELIGKVGGNWRGKERRQQVGIVIFELGNIQQVVVGLVYELVETFELKGWQEYPGHLTS